MFDWFKQNKKDAKGKLVPQKKEEEESEDFVEEGKMEMPPNVSIRKNPDETGVIIDSDTMNEEDKNELYQEFSKRSGIPHFEGEVKYGRSNNEG